MARHQKAKEKRWKTFVRWRKRAMHRLEITPVLWEGLTEAAQKDIIRALKLAVARQLTPEQYIAVETLECRKPNEVVTYYFLKQHIATPKST